jgi:diacylglycerol kinase (ATP)
LDLPDYWKRCISRLNMEVLQKKEWVFIINPVAGNGFASKYVPDVVAMLKEYNIDAELVFTERKGHASELANLYARNGFRYIIGVGGDGTLNEIAQSLVHNKDVTFGVIPAGTGNDFIQILGFPDRFEADDWKVFFETNTRDMDVGSCNGISFINGMGLGFDAQVAAQNYTADKKIKKGGKNKYIWHIVKTLLFFREKNMRVLSNGSDKENKCFINTISIGRRFAGSFFLTPKAIANDGMLDVCSIKELSLLQRFNLLLKVPKGTHIFNNKVHYYQTDKIILEFKTEVPFHVDGELNFSSKFDVGIFPEALRTIYNPNGKHFFKN